MWGDMASESPGWPSCLVTGGPGAGLGWGTGLTGSIQRHVLDVPPQING